MFNIVKFSLLATVSLLLLGGCSTPEQRKQRAAEESARKGQQEQAQLERLRSQCLKYGFTPQTNEFARCVQDEMRQEQAAASEKRKSDNLLAQCQQAMMLRGSGAGAGIANAGKCSADPYAHLRTETGNSNISKRNSGTGSLKREYISGMNKICIYDRLGSDVAITIRAVELCKLSPD